MNLYIELVQTADKAYQASFIIAMFLIISAYYMKSDIYKVIIVSGWFITLFLMKGAINGL